MAQPPRDSSPTCARGWKTQQCLFYEVPLKFLEFLHFLWNSRNFVRRLAMKYRTFGRTGWQVSESGYGMWQAGGQWGGSDDDESLRALNRAVELGCNFFDTAYAYGDGRSEKLLGQLVRAHPDKKLY